MWLIWVQEIHRKRLYAKRHAFSSTQAMCMCVCAMYGEVKRREYGGEQAESASTEQHTP